MKQIIAILVLLAASASAFAATDAAKLVGKWKTVQAVYVSGEVETNMQMEFGFDGKLASNPMTNVKSAYQVNETKKQIAIMSSPTNSVLVTYSFKTADSLFFTGMAIIGKTNTNWIVDEKKGMFKSFELTRVKK